MYSPQRTRRGQAFSHQRIVVFLGVLTLLLSLSAQLMSTPVASAAQFEDQQLQADQEQDENDPQAQPEVPQSLVQIEKFDCPAGTDWSQASAEQLFNGCGPNQQPVNMTVGGQTQQLTSFGEWGPFEGPADFQISEEPREQYGFPHFFCGVYVPGQSEPQANYFGATQGINASVQAGESLYCWIFNYQPFQEQEQFGTITLHKFACPDNWDFQDPYSASIDDLVNLCTDPLSAQIDVSQQGALLNSLFAEPSVTWDQVPAGPVSLSEMLPPGYQFGVVHCSYHEAGGEQNFAGNSQPMQMEDERGFSWNLEAGWVLECYWFNFPTDQIQLFKYWCPAEMPEQDSQTVEFYQNLCTELPGADIFWFLRDLTSDQEITDLSPGEGYAGYHQLEQNQPVGITEEIPTNPGYGLPFVYCFEFQRGEPSGQIYTQTYDPEAGVTWTPQEGFYLVCHFFNVLEGEDQVADGFGQIYVEKYWCPPTLAFVQTPTQGNMETACEETGTGATFELLGPQDEPQQWDPKSPEGGPPGLLSWEDVPGGQYLIQETGLGEGWTYWVYCFETNVAPNGELPEGELQETDGGNAIQWNLSPGYSLYCYWFNQPPADGEYNYVDFYKYMCPFDAPRDADQSYYIENCSPAEGWEFDLQWTEGSSVQSTDGEGHAGWSGIPTGPWQGSETLPESWDDPVVWCRVVEWPEEANLTGEWQQFEVPGGVLDGSFEFDGMRIECYWINFPAEDEYNYLEFYKLLCPDDAPRDAALEEYQTNCVPVPDWEFGLEYEGFQATQQTGGDGYVQWSGIPTGPWQASEVLPEGYADPVLWCRVAEWPEEADFDGEWQQFEAPGGVLEGGFEFDGMRIECYWINFGEPDDFNYIDFYKYVCADELPRDADRDFYVENCAPAPDWEFVVNYQGGESAQTTDPNGYASWSGIPQGEWLATETLQDGYTGPLIWCRAVEWPQEAIVNVDWQSVPYVNGVMEAGFGFDGMRIECVWINFGPPPTGAEEGGDNGILVYKYLCGPEVQPVDDLGAMLDLCTETQSGAPFELARTGDGFALEQSTVGGVAEWEDLAAGEYQLTERVVPGYGPPLFWCVPANNGPQLTEGDGQVVQMEPTEGTILLEIVEEVPRLVCFVFNFPPPENSVTVYKYNCDFVPGGYQTLGEWQEACPAQGNGRTFMLTPEGEAPIEMMTAGGSATWGDVPAGAFSLSEVPEPGWAEPVVWCGWTAYFEGNVYDAFPQKVPTTGGVYEGEFTIPGTTYFCFWFNIPDDDSWIKIYKFDCPEGMIEGVVQDPVQTYLNECVPAPDGIQFTLENSAGSSTVGTLGGTVSWSDVPLGPFTVTETVPQGYDPPLWFCRYIWFDDGEMQESSTQVMQPFASLPGLIEVAGMQWVCYVFDFPDPDRTVEVHKWLCPEGYSGNSWEDWTSNCTMPFGGVTFTLTDQNGMWTKPTSGSGSATWNGVSQGEVSIDEHIPPGYFEPVVYCTLEAVNGAAFAEGPTEVESTDGMISRTLDYSQYEWDCHFFNIPKGPGEITVNKWFCPAGYDFYGAGSVPQVDCTEQRNGVTFTLDAPVGPSQQTDTGDSIPGAVYWGTLDPGTYVITETVPSDIDHVFILECTGSDDDKVHPYPLKWGNGLTIEVAGGDSIVCEWYNVPEPVDGWVTVIKYQCWTPTFVSTVDCEIYEFGASFDLLSYPGGSSFGVGETDVFGQYSWYGLETGAYELDEISHVPCKITTSKTDGEGHIWVDAGAGTTVKVYNCKPKTPPPPGTPTVPGKPPGKYPNTGVGPSAESSSSVSVQESTPEASPVPEDEYFRLSCLDEPPEGTPVPSEDEEVAEAEDGTATETPEEFDLPIDVVEEATSEGTPDGTPTPEEECLRGALPERLVVDAIQADAGVEYLEIVDGVMQQPTGPELVSWYKETGRLGETNNVVIAAHLNYWGVPQGIFFYLDQLKEGDRVEVTGDDGLVYVFEVEWVSEESNLEAPLPEVIGPTDVPSLTLITCGGDWDASISEYNARTVARAVQVDVIDPAAEASEA